MVKQLRDILEDNSESVVNNGAGYVAPAPTQEPEDVLTEDHKKIIAGGSMTEDQVRAAIGYKPNMGAAVEYWNKVFKKPELDEKRLRNNRMLGAIGDSMKLLGQMYGVHKGVRIERNDPSQTLTSYFGNREDEARNVYQQRLDEWNRGYFNAHVSDEQMKNSYLMTLQNQLRAGLKDLAAEKNADKKTGNQREHEKEMLGIKISADATERERDRKHRIAIAYAEKGKLENDVLFITPHSSDSNSAIQTRANKRVLPVKLTKSEIDSYAAMAVADRDFAAANPELFKTLKLKGFDSEKTEATGIPAVDAKTMATAYMQYQYDKGFAATQAMPAGRGYQTMPWEYIPGLGGNGTAPGTGGTVSGQTSSGSLY
jgi:hypothetical protein